MRHASLPVFLIGITLSGHMSIDEPGSSAEQHNVYHRDTSAHQKPPLTTRAGSPCALSASPPTRGHCLRNP